MFRTRLCRAVVAAVMMCAGGGVLTTGTAHASGLVLSDKIKFSGTLVQIVPPNPYTYSIQVTQCSLTSYPDASVFPCTLSVNLNTNDSPPTGVLTAKSADGIVLDSWTFTPATVANTYTVKGTGVEDDNAEPGQPPVSYPCVIKGLMTVNPAVNPQTITGKIKVKESPTAP
jgi:hypothetical protein